MLSTESIAVEIPLLADQPVVALFERAVGRMEVVVLLEQPAILHVLVGPADLLADEPAQVPQQLRDCRRCSCSPSLQELDAAADVVIAVVVVVELDRHVVRQVPGLELPERDEVRLQLGELLERGGEVRPVLDLLVVVGLFPQQVHGDAAQAERRQLDRFAGRVDVAEDSPAPSLYSLRSWASLPPSRVVVAGALSQHDARKHSTTIATP